MSDPDRTDAHPTGEPAHTDPGDPRMSDDTLAAIDRPIDDVPLRDRLTRRGTARSTRILLVLVAVVVVFGVGALVGRATAPATGPGSVPPTVGVVDGVVSTTSGPVVTVRAPDGTLTTLRTSPGTVVAVPRAGGPGSVSAGESVTVTAERGADGALTATRIDVPR